MGRRKLPRFYVEADTVMIVRHSIGQYEQRHVLEHCATRADARKLAADLNAVLDKHEQEPPHA